MAEKRSNRKTTARGKGSTASTRRAVRSAVKTARRSPLIALIAVIAVLAAFAVWYFAGCNPGESGTATTAPPKIVSGTVEVHMIDVGQGDAILVRTDAGDMLIDTGDRTSDSKNNLQKYLSDHNVTELEWLVLTHPDADHIGGAVEVINACRIKRVLLSDRTNSSKTYTDTISAIIESEAEVFIVETDDSLETDETVTATVWKAGQTFSLGDADFKIFGPITNPTNNNNASVVMRMTYGASSILFTGDMEDEANNEIADVVSAYGDELRSDILKVGHHGSRNANNEALLSAVKPKIAIISCGEGNEYGHPHAETITLLEKIGAEIHRTDLEGNIVYRTNGTEWSRVGGM